MNVSTYFWNKAGQQKQLAEKLIETAELQIKLAQQILRSSKTDSPACDLSAQRACSDNDVVLDNDVLAHIANCLYKGRRDRESYFSPELFFEPAWDMLLDLLIAELTHKKTPVTNLCVASGVPTTTALRYIKSLEAMGLVKREPCSTDARIILLSLTSDAYSRMVACVKAQASRFWNLPEMRPQK